MEHWQLVLCSKSPRRQQLLKDLGFAYALRTMDIDEDFPEHLQAGDIPLFLSRKKADSLAHTIQQNEILIAADTVVWIHGHVLNKPADSEEAKKMLRELSGHTHEVFTAVTLKSASKQVDLVDRTEVVFEHLHEEWIDYYIQNYHPLDKAGAYGAQDFIGYVGIRELRGSYFNVMGLPVHRVFAELNNW